MYYKRIVDKLISLKCICRQIALFHENENYSVYGSVGRLKWLGHRRYVEFLLFWCSVVCSFES